MRSSDGCGFRQIHERLCMDWIANRDSLGWGAFLTGRWWAVLLFRISQMVALAHPLLAGIVKQLNQGATGADIAPSARIGGGLVLFHPVGVVIGSSVRIGDHCHIQQGVTIGSRYGDKAGALRHDGCPRLGAHVRLGAGSRIIGQVSLGDNVVVGANAVVLSDVPSGSLAVGIPASVKTRRSPDEGAGIEDCN